MINNPEDFISCPSKVPASSFIIIDTARICLLDAPGSETRRNSRVFAYLFGAEWKQSLGALYATPVDPLIREIYIQETECD